MSGLVACNESPRSFSFGCLMRNFMPHLKSLERVGTVQNTIPEELERYGFFEKSKARVKQHDDQSKEHHEGANLDQSCDPENHV